jgi:membrane protein
LAVPDFRTRFGGLWRFSLYCAKRFRADRCPRVAAALSYSTLLAVVPLLAVGLGILSVFPAFGELRSEVQQVIFDNLLPDVGIEVSEHFSVFVENARKATGFSLAILALTALLLLSTIAGSLNAIWRTAEPRRLVVRLAIYWAVLTFGPLFIGASISLSSYGFAMAEWVGVSGQRTGFGLAILLPLCLTTLGIAVLYAVGPGRKVQFGHAMTGAVVAAILFELLKAGFGFYFRQFPSYQAIYGAMAAIPVFLIWMYLSWTVVLVGAEIAAALPEWRAGHRLSAAEHGPGVRLALALALLQRLHAASLEGVAQKETALVSGLPAGFDELEAVLTGLRRKRFAHRTGSRWLLSRDLSAVTLDDLMRDLRLTLEPGEGWPEPIHALASSLDDAAGDQRARPLSEVLNQISPSRES